MVFDLAELDTLTLAEEGVEMPLLHPRTRAAILDEDGKTPLTITLAGRQSDAFRDVLKAIQSRRGELRIRGQEQDGDAKEREDIEILVACTRAWTLKMLDKGPFPCTPANVRKLWNDARFRTLRETAMAFLLTDANFLPPPSSASEDTPNTISSYVARFQPEAASQTLSEATV